MMNLQRNARQGLGVFFLAAVASSTAVAETAISTKELTQIGRALSSWIEVRESCGQGDAFEGSLSRMSAAGQAFNARLDALKGYSVPEAQPLQGLQAIRTLSFQKTVPNAQAMAANIQSLTAAIGKFSDTLKKVKDAEKGPYRVTLGVLQEKLSSARRFHRVLTCARADQELNFWVSTVLKPRKEKEDLPVELPNTLADAPLNVDGSECKSLQGFFQGVSELVRDSGPVVLSEQKFYVRAAVAQMAVEFRRKKARKDGKLSAKDEEKLRALTVALLDRFSKAESYE